MRCFVMCHVAGAFRYSMLFLSSVNSVCLSSKNSFSSTVTRRTEVPTLCAASKCDSSIEGSEKVGHTKFTSSLLLLFLMVLWYQVLVIRNTKQLHKSVSVQVVCFEVGMSLIQQCGNSGRASVVFSIAQWSSQ